MNPSPDTLQAFITGNEQLELSNLGGDKNLGRMKRARRQADIDAGILENRIVLLRQEEIKALKKVQETKLKTQEIYFLKERNEKRKLEKEMHLEMKNANLKATVVASVDLREQKRVIRQNIIQEIFESKHKDMVAIRKQRDLNNTRKWDVKNHIVEQNVLKCKLVKEQEALALKKRQLFIDNKLALLRLEKDKMYEEEEGEKLKKESLIRDLETVEMGLVKKLQTTQVMQKSAFEELKNAIVKPLELRTSKYSHLRTSSMGGLEPISSPKREIHEVGIHSTRGAEKDKGFGVSKSNMRLLSHRQSTDNKVGDPLN